MCQYKQVIWDSTKPLGQEITGVFCLKYKKIMNPVCDGNYEECLISNEDYIMGE